MMFMSPKIFQKVIIEQRASALLVALLLMGLLTVLGVGTSRLIVGAIRVERNVVESGKAYFAAEAGVERGLYAHRHRLAGYEVQKDLEAESRFILENGATVFAETVGVSENVPCAHRNEWRLLPVQESVSWPLFRWDAEKGRKDLRAFTLSFEFERITAVNGPVLRWKIFGLRPDGGTEAISGLMDSPNPILNENTTANFYAREGSTFTNYSHYSVKDFLEKHQFNYLTLTNVTDPSLQLVGAQTPESNVLKLKMSADERAACEYTLVRAVGESGGTRQSIDAQVKSDSFLPVFNFVLYQVESE